MEIDSGPPGFGSEEAHALQELIGALPRLSLTTLTESEWLNLTENQLLGLSETQPTVVLSPLLDFGDRTAEGVLVRGVTLPWLQIGREIAKDDNFLLQFLGHPHKFEEFIAGVYEHAGYEVVLTPKSGDQGRDIIATKRGYGAIRFLDQVKCYKPNHLVTHDDVRAMLGVLSAESPRASKALITTTSDFQPTVRNCDQFKAFVPYQLELKNGIETVEWIRSVLSEADGAS